MSDYLYKTVPMRRTLAPKRHRGQTAEEAIADAVGEILEEQAQDGWEFYRSDVFVAPAKTGWLSREQNAEFNILTFRKDRSNAALTEDESGWREPPTDYNYNDPYVDPALRRGAAVGAAAAGSGAAAAAGGVVRRRAPYPPSAGYDGESDVAASPTPSPAAPPPAELRPESRLESRRGAPKPRTSPAAPPQSEQTAARPGGEHARTADKLRRRARAVREQSSGDPDIVADPPKSGRSVIDDTISLSASMRVRPDRD